MTHDASPDHPNCPTHITATIDYEWWWGWGQLWLWGSRRGVGVMHDYTKAIHSQLHAETNRKKPVADKWMLKYLKGRIFVVVGKGCSIIIQVAQYTLQWSIILQDFKVWLPDEQWGHVSLHTSLIASQILESVHMDGTEIISQGVLLDWIIRLASSQGGIFAVTVKNNTIICISIYHILSWVGIQSLYLYWYNLYCYKWQDKEWWERQRCSTKKGKEV